MGAYNYLDQKINPKHSNTFKLAYAIDSSSHLFRLKLLNEDYLLKLSYRAVGCASYSAYNLFKGGYDFQLISDLSIWDVAAIILIADEIGLKSHRFFPSGKYGYGNFATSKYWILFYKPDLNETLLENLINSIDRLKDIK